MSYIKTIRNHSDEVFKETDKYFITLTLKSEAKIVISFQILNIPSSVFV